jgi:hypothetical protein
LTYRDHFEVHKSEKAENMIFLAATAAIITIKKLRRQHDGRRGKLAMACQDGKVGAEMH